MTKNSGKTPWWSRLPDTGAFLNVVICTVLFLYFVMRDTQTPHYTAGKVAAPASTTNALEPLAKGDTESTSLDDLDVEP